MKKPAAKQPTMKKPAAQEAKCKKAVTWATPIAKESFCPTSGDDDSKDEEEDDEEAEEEEELAIRKSSSSKQTVPDDEPRGKRKRLMLKTAAATKPARQNEDEGKPAVDEAAEPDSSSRYDYAADRKENSGPLPSKRLPPEMTPEEPKAPAPTRSRKSCGKLQEEIADEASVDTIAQAACSPAIPLPNVAECGGSSWDDGGGGGIIFHGGDESDDSMDRGPGNAFGF